jgi:hypothetical protein
MELSGEGEEPLFFVAASHRSELAAALLGCSLEELEFHMTVAQDYTVEDLQKALKLYKEYEGFKKNGIGSIGHTDEAQGHQFVPSTKPNTCWRCGEDDGHSVHTDKSGE